MTHEGDMFRIWIDEWTRNECLSGGARLDSLHGAWRTYWKLCARHRHVPTPIYLWALAVRFITGGTLQPLEHAGELCLLSESREVVRDALRKAKIKKTNYLRRRVAK